MDTVKNIYKLRENFAIVGLTGRTGSGCSTVADILTTEDVLPLVDVAKSKINVGHPNVVRKNKIISRFIRSNWKQYTLIKVSNIVIYFALLLNDFEKFQELLIDAGETDAGSKGKSSSSTKDVKWMKLSALKDNYLELASEVAEIDNYIEYDLDKVDEYYDELDSIFHDKIPSFREKIEMVYKPMLTMEFHTWSNNIRLFNSIEKQDSHLEKAPSYLAHKINRIIKSYHTYNKKRSLPTFIVVDALRNPYEVLYFRERYPAFYLMSINTSEDQRRKNLRIKRYDDILISQIETMEQEKKDLEARFSAIDLDKCIELSDIHISIQDSASKMNADLLLQIFKYLSLIYHPGLIPPSSEERIMQLAYTAKLNSGCLSRQVGAVVTNSAFSVISIGWNTVPEGQTPCSLRDFCHLIKDGDNEVYSDYELNNQQFRQKVNKLKNLYGSMVEMDGLRLPYCFKDIQTKDNQVHTRSLHAEENAFLQLAKYGSMGIKGGCLFTTASCCELCAKKAYQLGIRQIYFIDSYPGISDSHILHCGINLNRPNMTLFQGAVGRAYVDLFNPIIPQKDEFTHRTGVNVKKILYDSATTENKVSKL